MEMEGSDHCNFVLPYYILGLCGEIGTSFGVRV